MRGCNLVTPGLSGGGPCSISGGLAKFAAMRAGAHATVLFAVIFDSRAPLPLATMQTCLQWQPINLVPSYRAVAVPIPPSK